MRNKDEKAKEVVTDSRCAEVNRLTHLITGAILADNCFFPSGTYSIIPMVSSSQPPREKTTPRL
ncbi:TPA: hypothetical protein JBB11_12570 [Legionella pneumophila subsp. pneumophila]|nr:hypothetical protein [Legionella pneumophila subsp. pneumophila]HAT8934114.1 hypothetical protein [Legionella pneumophila subsp. pneumophila]